MRGLPEVRGRTREREVVRALAVWWWAGDAWRGGGWGRRASSWRGAALGCGPRPAKEAGRWHEKPQQSP